MSSRFSKAGPLFEDWAQELVETYEELSHVAVDEILFVEDTETETKSDAKKYMEIKRVPEWCEDLLGQHFGVARKGFAVIIYKLNCGALDSEAMIAHLAEQLLKIPQEGKALEKPDVVTFDPLAKALGYNWKQKVREKLPHLLKDRIPGWPARQVQATLETLPEASEDAADNSPPAPPADDWMPPAPYVAKPDNLVQFPGGHAQQAPTGTDAD